MLINQIPISSNIELQLKVKHKPMVLKSLVIGTNSNGIEIMKPMNGLRTINVNKNDELYVMYADMNVLRMWRCVVEDCGISSIKLSSCSDDIIYDRRKFDRVKVEKEIEYIWNNIRVFSGLLLNISYAGICIYSSEKHKEGDYISFQVDLQGIKVEVNAVIVRVSNTMESEYKYNYGATIINTDRNILGKYIKGFDGWRLSDAK